MPQSFIKIWIHAIWTTKNRLPLITPNVEKPVYDFMREELTSIHSPVRIINGMPDHIHCLFRLSREKTIAETIKQVKGSSSHYINQNDITPEKFAWQGGYAAFSVSESEADRVFHYIQGQKQHHLKQTFDDEYEEYIRMHGLIDEK